MIELNGDVMKKTKLTVLVVILVIGIVLTVAFASAQQPPRPPQPTRDNDPLAQFVFPPELVMQHQREIGLTDEQKTFLRGEIQRVTLRFTELQWQLQDSMEGLASIMKESSVNEQQALSQLDKILDTEREIKHLHIGLAIRIKNKLTPDQQSRLQGMKRMRPHPPDQMP
jgi:Spy/CpxP family protein refolding chaperone